LQAEYQAESLRERNLVLRDRIIDLEGVLLRWKDDIESFNSSSRYANLNTTDINVDITNEIESIQKKLLESQEQENILRTQLEQCQERSEAMRKLAEHLRKEEKEERS
jgi:hypothetical protein